MTVKRPALIAAWIVRSLRPHSCDAVFTDKQIAISRSFLLDFLPRIAQSCSDMQVQNHVKLPAGGYWYRCSRVELVDEMVKWELDPNSCYSFFEAYRQTPHRQLVEASDEIALRNFVKSWGPLYFSYPWESTWGNSQPINNYWNERDKLRATVQVLASLEETGMQRLALTQLLETLHKTSLDDIALHSIRQALQLPGNLHSGFDKSFRDWLERATSNQIEAATLAVVKNGLLIWSPLTSPEFAVERVGERNVPRAELGLHSLFDALNWMIWQDLSQNHPWQFCPECRKVFQPKWRHETKFCGSACAHRKASRDNWQRKHGTEGRKDGTQEAR